MDRRIEKINEYLVGWCGYFALADTPTPFKQLDESVRRRLSDVLMETMEITQNKDKETHLSWGSKRESL